MEEVVQDDIAEAVEEVVEEVIAEAVEDLVEENIEEVEEAVEELSEEASEGVADEALEEAVIEAFEGENEAPLEDIVEVVEAGSEEDSEEEEAEVEDTVVTSAGYSMTTDASLGLEIGISLDYMSSGKVRMTCQMAEEEAAEEADEVAEVPPVVIEEEAEITSVVIEEEADSSEVASEEDASELEAESDPIASEDPADIASTAEDSDTSGTGDVVSESRGLSKRPALRSSLPATIYLIASSSACSNMAAAVANGLTVEALPLAELTGVGDEVAYLDGVTWNDVKRADCIAVLKAPGAGKEIQTDDSKSTAYSAGIIPRRRRRSTWILRTAGLPRIFGAISLASFTVLSIGVTGAFAVAAGAAFVASVQSSSSSSSTSPITFWQANGGILTATASLLGILAFAYYLSRRDQFNRRIRQTMQSELPQISWFTLLALKANMI